MKPHHLPLVDPAKEHPGNMHVTFERKKSVSQNIIWEGFSGLYTYKQSLKLY